MDENLDEYIEKFIDIKNYLIENMEPMIDVYLTDIWDPCIKYVLIKETNNVITNLLTNEFPDFPREYLPKVKFVIDDEENNIEAGVQEYLNVQSDMIFLGCCQVGGSCYDFYIKESWNPNSPYIFYARYGHSHDSVYSGSEVAEYEYFNGILTPLSVAFSMAIENGFIK